MVTEIKYYLKYRDNRVENKTVGKYPRYLKSVVCLQLLGCVIVWIWNISQIYKYSRIDIQLGSVRNCLNHFKLRSSESFRSMCALSEMVGNYLFFSPILISNQSFVDQLGPLNSTYYGKLLHNKFKAMIPIDLTLKSPYSYISSYILNIYYDDKVD